MASSSAASSRLAIITGANTGIGKETTLGLAKSGEFSTLILACRSVKRGLAAVRDLRAQLPASVSSRVTLQVAELDLGSLRSVVDFARDFVDSGRALHVLVCNAGLNGAGPTQRTADGLEVCFGVNFLGHFLLTQLLLPALSLARGRVVNVSSVMHRLGKTDFASASNESPQMYSSYRTSKLAQVLYSYEFNRVYMRDRGVVSIAVSPGGVNSDIWRYNNALGCVAHCMRRTFLLTPAQGAATSIAAATTFEPVPDNSLAPDEAEREFCFYLCPYWVPNSCPTPFAYLGFFNGPTTTRTSPTSYDADAARKCWAESVELLAPLLEDLGEGDLIEQLMHP